MSELKINIEQDLEKSFKYSPFKKFKKLSNIERDLIQNKIASN